MCCYTCRVRGESLDRKDSKEKEDCRENKDRRETVGILDSGYIILAFHLQICVLVFECLLLVSRVVVGTKVAQVLLAVWDHREIRDHRVQLGPLVPQEPKVHKDHLEFLDLMADLVPLEFLENLASLDLLVHLVHM